MTHRHRPPSSGATGRSGRPRSIVDLIRLGVLDADLAALTWLLIEGRVPVLVAGTGPLAGSHEAPSGRVDRAGLRDVLVDFLPPTVRRVPIDTAGRGLEGLTAVDTGTTCLVGLDITTDPATGAQLPLRTLSRGGDLAASIEADSLEEVFARLRRLDLRLSDDELTFIGMVLVLRAVDRTDGTNPAGGAGGTDGGPGRDRVVAAHYVRPLARDPGGHVQRMGPAVLATWEAGTDTFEQFAWGVSSELAGRVGLRPGDIDAEVDRRRDYLAGLAVAGVGEAAVVRAAIESFRLSSQGRAGH